MTSKTFEIENLVEELILKICKEGVTEFTKILLSDILNTISEINYTSDRLLIDIMFLNYTCTLSGINIEELNDVTQKTYYNYLEQIADKTFMVKIEQPTLYSSLFDKIINKNDVIYNG